MLGCICPHPPLLIPEIGSGTRAQVRATIDGMQRLADAVGDIETAVIVSPHSAGYADAHLVKTAPHLEGDFGAFRCPQVRLTFENDLPFVDLLLALAGQDRRLTVAPSHDGLLDHGVLVPMSFLRARRLVSLSIVNDYGEHKALGQLVRRCAAELGRDVLFVASGDMSHRLSPSAPAGYDPRGKMFDDAIVELLGVGDFAGLADLDRTIVSGAGECGLRSFIALGGFLGDDADKAPTIYSYEGPFGVGYLVAGFGGEAGGEAGA
jgi:aromatic ring-opening dioxygenase LigB subunit